MSSSAAVLETLNWIRAQQFIPVPLRHGTKAIQTAKDKPFPSPSNDPSNELWRDIDAAPLNIGVVTGPLAHGPIDIDLDCDEASKLARFFLPHSPCVFGRASRPNSHYFYKIQVPSFPHTSINDPSPKETLRGTKPNILEIRGDNSQTMMPGSVHPNGETIEWYTPPHTLDVINHALVLRGCNLLAAAVLAHRYIWLPGERHESTMQIAGVLYNLKYSQDEANNFIQALISISGADDPAHLATVRSTYSRSLNDRPVLGASSLQKRFRDSNPAMIRLFLKLLGYSTVWLDEMNERYACVLIGGRYKIAVLPTTPGDLLTYTSVDDFKNFMAGQVVKVTSTKGQVKDAPLSALWLNHPERRSYSKVTFWPGEDLPPERVHYLNEWTGWPLQPIDNLEKCKAFRTFVERYLTDPLKPEQARWVYTYFAHMLKKPRDKQRAAVVIIGPQKIGKTVFVNYFGKILGAYHLNVADAAKIHGRFNYHLKNCIFLHSEEAIFGQDKRHRAIIKDLISNDKLQFEAKYAGIESGQSYCRIIYTSNEDGAAPIELGDTRHTVFNFKINRRIPPRELVIALYREAMSDGPAALMHFLKNLPELPSDKEEKEKILKNADYPTRFYDLEALGEPLDTLEKRNSLAFNLEPVDEYWLNKLELGELLDERLRWAQGSPRTRDYADKSVKWPASFSRRALYVDYILSNAENKAHIVSSYRFFKRLEEWTKMSITFKNRSYTNPLIGDTDAPKAVRELTTGIHSVVSTFPPLDKCRKSFEKYCGEKFNWPVITENDEDDTPAQARRDSQEMPF
jgi:hypothetical protein